MLSVKLNIVPIDREFFFAKFGSFFIEISEIYTLSQKNLCTQKEMFYNHETSHVYSVWGNKQMIKNSE